jgi:hypothetical protein
MLITSGWLVTVFDKCAITQDSTKLRCAIVDVNDKSAKSGVHIKYTTEKVPCCEAMTLQPHTGHCRA